MGMKCAILLVAYGTNSPQGQASLGRFDDSVRQTLPNVPVRWAYSSHLLRERLAKARRKSDSVRKALRKLCFENFDTILVQPLQTIPGREHEQVLEDAAQVSREQGISIRVGAPLLASSDDIGRVAQALVAHLPKERLLDEDVVLMGHGGAHEAAIAYTSLAKAVHALDTLVHVGAMGGELQLENLLPQLQSHRVWLMPLLATVGRHTLEDMAGQGAQSWRSRIEASGHECVPVLKGTVEHDSVARVWLDHLVCLASDINFEEAGA